MRRIYRGLVHLRTGTLFQRLRQGWRQRARLRRLAWWESQIGKLEEVEITLQAGVRLRLHLDAKLSELIYCGGFEWQERVFLNAFLRPGDVFVDVGANIGLFTSIAAHRVGNTGHVYALEPCFKAYQRLLANVRLNRLTNVSCHQLALSDRAVQTDMVISLDGFDAWNSLAQPIAGSSFAVETVNCILWDEFANQHNLTGRVTMMKMDVEGWESRVVLGAYRTLSRADAPVLQVEFTEEATRAAGSSCAGLYQLLEQLGYRMFVYDAMSQKLIPDPLRDTYPYVNLIAVKQPEAIVSRLKSRSRLPWLW